MILDTKTQTPFYFSYPSPYARVLNSWQKIPIAVGGIPFLKPYGNRSDAIVSDIRINKNVQYPLQTYRSLATNVANVVKFAVAK